MASDGSDGAWVAWEDLRGGGTNHDIYAARVGPSGTVVGVPAADGSSSTSRVWPEPFTSRVEMEFVAPVATGVHATVVDLRGRVVADLGSSRLSPGAHRVAWDGRTSDGRAAAAGVYFLRVEGPGIALSRRVVRLK